MSAIRSVCKTFRIPYAAPHIFVGVSSIAKSIREQQAAVTNTPAKRRARKSTGTDEVSPVVAAFDEIHIPALMVVVAFFTRSHLLGAPQAEEYAVQRAEAITAISKVVPDDVAKDEETTITMIEDLLREAENGWLDMEWYHNLPEPVAEAEEEVDDNERANTTEEGEGRPVQTLQVPKRGFGSMMTDATDYLSDERQTEYKRWKTGVLRRIAQIEKQGKGKAIAV